MTALFQTLQLSIKVNRYTTSITPPTKPNACIPGDCKQRFEKVHVFTPPNRLTIDTSENVVKSQQITKTKKIMRNPPRKCLMLSEDID